MGGLLWRLRAGLSSVLGVAAEVSDVGRHAIPRGMGHYNDGPLPERWEHRHQTEERERIENTNPVTRYLDRRRNERGGVWIAQYNLPWHPYWLWMSASYDHDFPEFYAPKTPAPHLHYKDTFRMDKTFTVD